MRAEASQLSPPPIVADEHFSALESNRVGLVGGQKNGAGGLLVGRERAEEQSARHMTLFSMRASTDSGEKPFLRLSRLIWLSQEREPCHIP